MQTLYLVIISYSMFAILGAFLIVPFRFLLTDISNNSTMIFGNIASLIITLAATHFLDFSPIYQFILKRDFWFNAVILNIFIALFVVITVSKVDLKLTIAYYPLIFFYVVIAVLFNIALINSKHKIIVQEQIIRQYNEYLPVIDKLVDQVRARQHQYKNDLNALNSLALTCDNPDELKAEILKNISVLSNENTPYFLLDFNLKLIAGFIYTEHLKAVAKQINISYNIHNFNIITIVPEYVLVELLGILIDNAIENSYTNDIIYIDINCSNNKLNFSISNPGPTVTPEIVKNFFKKGYTTKNIDVNSHGYGLFNLKNALDEYNGTITLDNEILEHKQYIKFTIVV
ncbi:MAG: GHKL domain-containing protein [Lachnospiraceae bacterium]|nr:GHKL domain-containing protein [Lachnospiraceae bacterium]